jgi:hypothetical protein
MAYRMTRHGEKRAQQRGIKFEAIKFIIENADIRRHAGDGRRELGISRRRLAVLRRKGSPATLIERTDGKRIIAFEESGVTVVVTTYPLH